MSYEWMRQSQYVDRTGFESPEKVPARRAALESLISNLEKSLEEAHYFFPPDREERLRTNLRSLFVNAGFQDPEIQSLHGMIAALERRWKHKK